MIRFLISVVLGFAVAFGLLFLMQALIASGQSAITKVERTRIVDFVRVQREETVERKREKPDRPPNPDQPPPEAPQPSMSESVADTGAAQAVQAVDHAPVPVSQVEMNVTTGFGLGDGAADGDYLPIVKVAPVYPRRAIDLNIEGYVVVEFTVTKTGAVRNPVVVEFHPSPIFNKASAVMKLGMGEPVREGCHRLVRTTAALAAAVLLFSGSVLGQDQEGQTYQDVETEAQASMRNEIYQELAKAQEKAEAGQFPEATRLLDELREDEELNHYELAQTWNLYAYIYYSQDNYPRAIEAYERLLAQPELPEALETSTLYTLSQLYFATENWRKAIDALDRWTAAGETPKAQTYEMMAQAYYQLEEYREALRPAQRAIELTLAEGRQPAESLYLILRVLHYELKEYDRVESVLQELIRRYPKKQYWLQLISIYGEMEDERKQLQALQLAYVQGFLDQQAQLVTLASLLLQNDLPYKGGKVLEKGLADGTIESTADHWRLLAQAWTLAQENEKAIPALTRASELSNDGNLDVILAQTYINLERWDEAVQTLRGAIRKGGLRRTDQAYVMLGQTLFSQSKFTESRRAFESAQSDSRSRQLAAQWITYIEREEDRVAQLESALD